MKLPLIINKMGCNNHVVQILYIKVQQSVVIQNSNSIYIRGKHNFQVQLIHISSSNSPKKSIKFCVQTLLVSFETLLSQQN